MNLKMIAKCSLVLYVSLVLSGIPIGYFIADIGLSRWDVPIFIIFYKYVAIFLISTICFYFLTKSCEYRPLLHAIIVLLLMSGVSSIADYFIFSEIDYFVWLVDFSLVVFSLLIGYWLSFLQKARSKHINSKPRPTFSKH